MTARGRTALLLTALVPPLLVSPPDDPASGDCLPVRDHVDLGWERQQGAAWLIVKARVRGGAWTTWVRQWVRTPPFRLEIRSDAARHARFAWQVLAVDAADGSWAGGDWHYFCTRPG